MAGGSGNNAIDVQYGTLAFVINGFRRETVDEVGREVSEAFPGALIFLAPEVKKTTSGKDLPGTEILCAGTGGSRSEAFNNCLDKALEANTDHIVIIDANRVKEPAYLLNKISTLTSGKEITTFLVDESALIRENSRNPVFQIFRNFLFWAETGFRTSLQKAPVIVYPARLIRSFKLTPFKEGRKREFIIRAIWKEKPDIIPVASTSVKKPSGKVNRRFLFSLSQLFLMHTWLLMKSIFYVQPKAAIRLFTVANLKAFIRKELLSPGEPAYIKALSVSIGIFCGIIPLWGWQTIIAITLSLSFRLNKMITITTSSLSITPLLPLILYLSYYTGGYFIGDIPSFEARQEITLEFVKVHFLQYFIGAFIFAFIAGIFTGLFTWGILKIFGVGRKKDHISRK